MTYLDHTTMNRSRNYVVVVTETLVAYDIALTIADYDSAANVICANSTGDAEAMLADIASVEIAFVTGSPAHFFRSTLHETLIKRGCRVVLLGIEAEVTGPTPEFDVLAQPFDTAAVLAKLQELSS